MNTSVAVHTARRLGSQFYHFMEAADHKYGEPCAVMFDTWGYGEYVSTPKLNIIPYNRANFELADVR